MKLRNGDALFRVAVLGAVGAAYYAPRRVLRDLDPTTAPKTVDAAFEAELAATEFRLALTFGLTLVSLLLASISPPLVLASCLHAALHLVQYLIDAPDPSVGGCLATGRGPAICGLALTKWLTFLAILWLVLFPPPSALASRRRYSNQLRKFFRQHDPRCLGLIDRLLEDYAGNERLLFAYIRRIYRQRLQQQQQQQPLKTP